MLIGIGFSQPLLAYGALDDGEVGGFLALVVVVQHLGPALAEGEEVACRACRHVLALQVHCVHSSSCQQLLLRRAGVCVCVGGK